MRRLVIIFLLLMGSLNSIKSQSDMDSMIRVLDLSIEDTTRLRLLGEISNYFRTRDYDTAVHYIEQYVILAREIDDQSVLAEAYYFLAGPLSHLGVVNTALEYYNRAREIYEDLGDAEGMARVYNGFGRIYLEYERSRGY